jgi:hypothetical protein
VRDPGTRRWYPFVPDGYFEIEYESPAPTTAQWAAYGGGTPAGRRGLVQCAVVEVDLGTMDLRRFQRKLRGFELALELGLFEREWRHPEFEVLVLTNTAARLEHVWQAAREVVPADRWSWYSFATMEALEPTAFAGHGWLTLERDCVHLLLDPIGSSFPNPPHPASNREL